jgi:hypothetical protein
MSRIPVLFCVDIEPDPRDVRSAGDWCGFEATFEYFQALRPRLEAASGLSARYAWFLRMDPQVAMAYGSPDWAARRYARQLDTLRLAGDEIGLHPHAWRWVDERSSWVADHANQEWVDACVRVSFETYERVFGVCCRAFRFGDHWMNDATLALVESLGAVVDLTLEPGQSPTHSIPEPFTGSFPDYTHVPQRPYLPSISDFRRTSDRAARRIWEVPLSAGSIWPIMAPDSYLARTFGGYESGTDPYQTFKLASRAPVFTWLVDQARTGAKAIGRYAEKYETLNLAAHTSLFSQVVDGLLAVKRVPYLAIVARTDVSIDPVKRGNLEQNINYLLSHPILDRFGFRTPSEVVPDLARMSGH